MSLPPCVNHIRAWRDLGIVMVTDVFIHSVLSHRKKRGAQLRQRRVKVGPAHRTHPATAAAGYHTELHRAGAYDSSTSQRTLLHHSSLFCVCGLGVDEFDFDYYHGVAYDDHSTYEGAWEGHEKEGFGVLRTVEGTSFIGSFKASLVHGYGKHLFQGGTGSYVGEFAQGRYHGHGCFTAPNGDTFEGQFEEGHARGLGVVTHKDGTREEGLWEGGKRVGACDASAAVLAARAVVTAVDAHIALHTAPPPQQKTARAGAAPGDTSATLARVPP